MASLKLTLDTRRVKKDNTYPIVFRLAVNTSYRDIATGFSSKESDWNNRTNCLKETHPTFTLISRRKP